MLPKLTTSQRKQALLLRQQGNKARQVARTLGVSSVARYRDDSFCECGEIKGRQQARCHACEVRSRTRWNQETVVDALHRWYQLHGKTPTAMAWAATTAYDPDYPGLPSIYDTRREGAPFRSWLEAIDAAGLPRLPRGRPSPYPGGLRQQVAQVVAEQGPVGVEEIRAHVAPTPPASSVSQTLYWLRDRGQVQRIGRDSWAKVTQSAK